MKNYTNIAIVASFFGLWMDSYFSTNLQIISGFLLILSFGIVHGANDLQLIDKLNSANQPISMKRILIYYILVVLMGIALFYVFPLLALLIFIAVSAYHFGEQQWQKLPNALSNWFLVLYQFLYGFVILFLLFVFHTDQVQNIILEITNFKIPAIYFWEILKVSGIAFICLSAYLYGKITKIREKLLLEIFHLLVFTIIFKSSSLIWGFAIYFIVWHSIPSIIDQIKFLNGTLTLRNFYSYCRSAGNYWLVSVAGIILIYYLFQEEQLFNAVFFSFLAAITFPHAFVISRMFGGKT